MPRLCSFFVLPSIGSPFEHLVRHKKKKLNDVLEQFSDVNKGGFYEVGCPYGVIMCCKDKVGLTKNGFATALHQKGSDMSDETALLMGTCFLVNIEKKNGTRDQFKRDMVAKVLKFHDDRIGRDKPTRPRTAKQQLMEAFKSKRRAELKARGEKAGLGTLSSSAAAAWAGATNEEKNQYEALAAAGRQEYDSQMKVYRAKHPACPRGASMAYNIYVKEHPDGTTRVPWKEVSDADRVRYIELSKLDMERYKAEAKVYREYCSKNNLFFKESRALKPSVKTTGKKRKRKASTKDNTKDNSTKDKVKKVKKAKKPADVDEAASMADDFVPMLEEAA